MANTITTNAVIKINGKEVENSFIGIRKEVSKLESELKRLPQNSEEFKQKSKELENARQVFAEITKEVNKSKEAIKESSKEVKSFSDMWALMADKAVGSIDVTNMSIKGLGSGIKTMALQAWAAISSIPIAGWIAAVVGALALGMKEVMDYNNQLYEANKLTADITRLHGEALDKMTVRSQTLEEILGLDRKETLTAARNLVENFGITYDQAMDEIESGAIRGGKANDEFLDSLREYPVFFAKAGFSAKDFINIINAGFDLGIYSDKLPDAIKEFDLSMREQTKSTRDALVNAFGATFSDDILKRVSSGKTTVKDALIEINKESEKYNLTQKQQAQLTADIFRGAGEDVGGFANIMDAVTVALIEQGGVLTEQQQIIKDQIDNYNELGEAKLEALKSDAVLAFKRDVENSWTAIKTLWFKFLVELRSSVNGLQLAFLNTRDTFYLLPKAVSSVFSAMKIDFQNMGSIAASFGKLIKDAFTNWDNVGNSYDQFTAKLKNGFSTTSLAIKNVGKDLADINSKNVEAIKSADAAKAAAQRILDKRRENAGKSGNNNDGSEANKAAKAAADKAAKAAEAARKKAETDRKKALEEQRKDFEESLKAEAEANNRSLDAEIQHQIDKLKLQEDSYEKEKALAELERSKEFNNQRKQQDEILKNIEELEKKKSAAKSPEAANNYEEALKKERKLLETHDQIILTSEETHQLKLKTIREKWDAKKFENDAKKAQRDIENARRDREDEITNISTLEEAKAQLLAQSDLKLTDQELRAIDNLEDAKNALREAANRAMLKQQEKAILLQIENLKKALNDPSLSAEARKQLEENLDFLKDKISQVQSAIQGGTDSDNKKVQDERQSAKENTDILGFSAADWEKAYKNLETTEGKINALGMAFQALGNAGQMFSQLIQAQNEKELRQFTKVQDQKKKALLKQLNEGYINQEEYTKATQKLEVDAANKKAELEYKQAKADKIARMFGAIGATAQAVATALTAGPIAGPILAAIVGALGAVQIGIIAAQPLPEKPSFDGGGFTGGGFGAPDDSGFKPAGIVHENEWVAPKWMLEEPRTAKVIEYLESVRTGKTQPFAEGGFSNSTSQSVSDVQNPEQDTSTTQMLSAIADLKSILQDLKDNGVEAWMVENAENGKALKRTIKKFEKIENQNARKTI